MSAATPPHRRAVLALLGLPPGSGVLFSRGTKVRLALALVGLLLVAALEIVALAGVLVLVQLLTGTGTVSGPAGELVTALGLAGTDAAVRVAALVLSVYVVKALFTIAFRWWLFGLMARQQVETSSMLFRHYLSTDYVAHLRRSGPEFLSTTNDAVNQVYTRVVTASIVFLSDLTTVAAIAVTLLVIYPVQTLAVAAYLVVTLLAFQRLAKRRTLWIGREVIDGATAAYRSAMEGLGTVKEVKVNGVVDHFVDRYRAASMQVASANRRAAFLNELPKHVLEILFVVGIGVMTAVSFARTDAGEALAVIAVFATAGFRALPSLVRAMASLNSVRVGRHSLDKVLDDVREARRDREPPRTGTPMPFTDRVRLEGVDFAYDNGVPVLDRVSLDIRFGSSVALVGRSGAGKSTLVDIVLGLLQPSAGRVLVDGVDIREDLDGWWRCIGLVPQPVTLIDGTVRDNVAFGLPPGDVDDDRVWEALQRADLHEAVRGMDHGLDTLTGERGVRLSGGQRQRIGIARALYRRPALLVLDEATSALDNETERRISDTIASLQSSVTTLIVAHRLSTVKDCDLIVLLSEGRVRSVGSFEELRDTSPEFARMVELGALT